jgi:hypothetical protein
MDAVEVLRRARELDAEFPGISHELSGLSGSWAVRAAQVLYRLSRADSVVIQALIGGAPSEEGVSQASDGAVNGVTHQDAQDTGPSPMFDGAMLEAPAQFSLPDMTPVEDMTWQFLEALVGELERARAKWPGNRVQMTALTEEVGELAKALLHLDYEGGTAPDVWKEAVQVAAMAVRVATEGDSSFGYRPVCGVPVPPKAVNLPK